MTRIAHSSEELPGLPSVAGPRAADSVILRDVLFATGVTGATEQEATA